MDERALRDVLSTDLCVTGSAPWAALSAAQYRSKIANIHAFFSIDRTGLANGGLEHLLLMYRSSAGERIFIEYPGKESTAAYAASGPAKIQNPYDLRPELYLQDGTLIAKLSFFDIADSIVRYQEALGEARSQILAAMLIRLAFMEGFSYVLRAHPRSIVTFPNGIRTVTGPSDAVVLGRYFLSLGHCLKGELSSWPLIEVPDRERQSMVPITAEGLLYYMDMLSQQEDCKYYHSARMRGLRRMSIGVGRVNNLLTIANIIDRSRQGRSCEAMIDRLRSGVFPLEPTAFGRVTGGIVTVHYDHRAFGRLYIDTDRRPGESGTAY